jgi:GT2 family glycosyltransferase
MSQTVFSDLTLATTIHNNLERWMEMALSFEREAGLVAEIVVVDDGSDVPARIEGLRSPLRILRNETPHGFCGASDEALREVKTPFALLVDADITFLEGDFAAAFAAFKAVPRLAWSNFQQVSATGELGGSSEDVLAPPWIYALGNQVQGRWSRYKAKTIKPAFVSGRIKSVTIAHSSSTLVRMNAFQEIDGFDRRFWQCESDNDLCLRLIRAGWKVGVDRLYTVRHDGIGGKTGGTKRIYDLYRGRLMLYEVHHPEVRVYLRPLLALRHALEALTTLVRPRAEEHLTSSFRFRLATAALKGYPKLKE